MPTLGLSDKPKGRSMSHWSPLARVTKPLSIQTRRWLQHLAPNLMGCARRSPVVRSPDNARAKVRKFSKSSLSILFVTSRNYSNFDAYGANKYGRRFASFLSGVETAGLWKSCLRKMASLRGLTHNKLQYSRNAPPLRKPACYPNVSNSFDKQDLRLKPLKMASAQDR